MGNNGTMQMLRELITRGEQQTVADTLYRLLLLLLRADKISAIIFLLLGDCRIIRDCRASNTILFSGGFTPQLQN